MNDAHQADRMIALFLLAVLAFSPPLLSLFDADTLFIGMPLLFVYLFAAWAAVVGLLAIAIEGRGRTSSDLHSGTPTKEE
ncbi:MAG: hypothetical protein HY246_21420 [Proteobacteria bacterium]|nr:hypothetical protein [Pseudomonadota bacterium]